MRVRGRWLGVIATVLALGGCGGDEAGTDLGRGDAPDGTTLPDAAPDGGEPGSDAGRPDAGADVPLDVPADVPADVPPGDGPADGVAADVPPVDDAADATPDATPDATDADDAAGDAAGDAEVPFPPDVPLAPSCQGTREDRPWAPAAGDPSFPRGPRVQDIRGDRATITWRAEPGAGTGCVHLGDPALTTCGEPDEAGNYAVPLVGLPVATTMPYRVEAGGKTTATLELRTAPPDDAPMRLMLISDAHQNVDTLSRIAAAGLAAGVDVAVEAGDFVDRPELELFDQAFHGLRPLLERVTMWPVIGNHEERTQLWSDQFVAPGASPSPDPANLYYDVRIGTVWIGVLELTEFLFGDGMPQVEWLKGRLWSPEARTARWRLLFIHQPPWNVGWGHCGGYHGEYALRSVLLPIAAQADVNAIVSGHVHGYEHGVADGVHLFVVGGAGGGLDMACEVPEGLPDPWTTAYVHHWVQVDAACDSLVFQAIDLDGNVFDRVEIQ